MLTVALVYNSSARSGSPGERPGGDAGLFRQALTTAHRAPDRFTILISLYNLAISSHGLGDLSSAAAHLTKGSRSRPSGGRDSTACYLEGLATMATRGRPTARGHPARRRERTHGGQRQRLAARSCRAFPTGDEPLAALRSRLRGPAFEAARTYGPVHRRPSRRGVRAEPRQTSTPDRDPSVSGRRNRLILDLTVRLRSHGRMVLTIMGQIGLDARGRSFRGFAALTSDWRPPWPVLCRDRHYCGSLPHRGARPARTARQARRVRHRATERPVAGRGPVAIGLRVPAPGRRVTHQAGRR